MSASAAGPCPRRRAQLSQQSCTTSPLLCPERAWDKPNLLSQSCGSPEGPLLVARAKSVALARDTKFKGGSRASRPASGNSPSEPARWTAKLHLYRCTESNLVSCRVPGVLQLYPVELTIHCECLAWSSPPDKRGCKAAIGADICILSDLRALYATHQPFSASSPINLNVSAVGELRQLRPACDHSTWQNR